MATQFWLMDSNILLPAIVSSIVSIAIAFAFRWFELYRTAELVYRFEQKKKLKDAIGKNLGRLLIVAEKLDDRFVNLSGNYGKDWLRLSAKYSESGYYMFSTVLRFLDFYEAIFKIQAEAITLDARHADQKDYEFLNYVAIFQWVMRDIRTLFENIPYDSDQESDHLYADSLRDVCTRFSAVKDKDRSHVEMKDFFDTPENAALLKFFEGLSKSEHRKRWDRIVALWLLLVALEDSFGHKRHKTTLCQVTALISNCNDIRVLENLKKGLLDFDLYSTHAGNKLVEAIDLEYRNRIGSFSKLRHNV